MQEKTTDSTDTLATKNKTPDVKVTGNPDAFQLLFKASSDSQGWMKSTKAMETPKGCVVQVTTQQGDNVAEALTFVPDVSIKVDENGNKYLG